MNKQQIIDEMKKRRADVAAELADLDRMIEAADGTKAVPAVEPPTILLMPFPYPAPPPSPWWEVVPPLAPPAILPWGPGIDLTPRITCEPTIFYPTTTGCTTVALQGIGIDGLRTWS